MYRFLLLAIAACFCLSSALDCKQLKADYEVAVAAGNAFYECGICHRNAFVTASALFSRNIPVDQVKILVIAKRGYVEDPTKLVTAQNVKSGNETGWDFHVVTRHLDTILDTDLVVPKATPLADYFKTVIRPTENRTFRQEAAEILVTEIPFRDWTRDWFDGKEGNSNFSLVNHFQQNYPTTSLQQLLP